MRNNFEVTVKEEIADVSAGRPHVLLLGAGASFAALPNGDKNGRSVPLLRDVAQELRLVDVFPKALQNVATDNFEAGYSRLHDLGLKNELDEINRLVHRYFSELELPDTPNLYDVIHLSLREKDAIFTFNWDPFLIQSRIRLAKLNLAVRMPKLFFLHGNVLIGWCDRDETTGIVGRKCSKCGADFRPSQLLFPVEHKDYQSDSLIKREWEAMRWYLKNCSVFTIFGYSAPTTDKEAVDLLKLGWGDVHDRSLEQTEIINRPGLDEDALRKTWDPFIHTHHYNIETSFYKSLMGEHPRRSIGLPPK